MLLCIAAAADVKQVSAHASWCAVQLDAAKKLCPSYGFRSANECAAQVLPLVDGTCSQVLCTLPQLDSTLGLLAAEEGRGAHINRGKSA